MAYAKGGLRNPQKLLICIYIKCYISREKTTQPKTTHANFGHHRRAEQRAQATSAQEPRKNCHDSEPLIKGWRGNATQVDSQGKPRPPCPNNASGALPSNASVATFTISAWAWISETILETNLKTEQNKPRPAQGAISTCFFI